MSIPLKPYKNRLLFILLTCLSVETYASADLTFTIDNYPVTLNNVNTKAVTFKTFVLNLMGYQISNNDQGTLYKLLENKTVLYLGEEGIDTDSLETLFKLGIKNNVTLTTTKPNKNSSSNDDKDKNNGKNKKKSGNNGNDGNINSDNQQNGQGGLWANHKKTIIGGTAGVLLLAIGGIFLLNQSREEEEEQKINKASLA